MTGPLNLRRNPNVDPIERPWDSPILDAGIAEFNAGRHWHAHEAWEPLWMGLEGDDKLFVQGLIMAAAMLVQYRKGVRRGVTNHWRNVQLRLTPHAPQKWGIDVDGLLTRLAAYAADAADDADADDADDADEGQGLLRDTSDVRILRAGA